MKWRQSDSMPDSCSNYCLDMHFIILCSAHVKSVVCVLTAVCHIGLSGEDPSNLAYCWAQTPGHNDFLLVPEFRFVTLY